MGIESPRPARRRRPVRWLLAPLRLGLALVILFEEWGWEPLQRLMARIARLPVLRQAEAMIARLPPAFALLVFFLPGLLLLPVKIGALWLMANGQKLLGLGVIVVAKVVGTAIVARLFTLTRPALMRLAWFAAAYQRWSAWKALLLAWVRESAVWRTMHAWRLAMREAVRAWAARWFGRRRRAPAGADRDRHAP
jgi:hypothetical protein